VIVPETVIVQEVIPLVLGSHGGDGLLEIFPRLYEFACVPRARRIYNTREASHDDLLISGELSVLILPDFLPA
jgi:hypothetical protein